MKTKRLRFYGSCALIIALIAIVVLASRTEHKLDTTNTVAFFSLGIFGLSGLILRFMEVHLHIRDFLTWINIRKPLRLLD